MYDILQQYSSTMNAMNEIFQQYSPIMNAVNGTCKTTERWKLCLMQLRMSKVGSLKIKNTTSGTIYCGSGCEGTSGPDSGAAGVRIRPS